MLPPSPPCMRATAITPAEPAGARVARFPAGGSLPRIPDGSASALPVSRPARRSLALRPACSLNRPRRPFSSKCFRQSRYLLRPLRVLPAGATVAGRASHPLGNGALPRRTRKLRASRRMSELADLHWNSVFSSNAPPLSLSPPSFLDRERPGVSAEQEPCKLSYR